MTAQLIRVMLLALAVAAAPTFALADKGGAPNVNSGRSSESANPSSGKKVKAPPGQAKKKVLPQTDDDAANVLVQVTARNAISLSALKVAIEAVSGGRILDVTLVRISGRLVYDVTVQETNNLVRHIFIDADSGVEVVVQ